MPYGDGDDFNFASSVHGDVDVTLNLTINVYGSNGQTPVVAPDDDFQRAVEAAVLQAMKNMKQQAISSVRPVLNDVDDFSSLASRAERTARRRGIFAR